jgi:O-antigen/teichoic acid export membrane protein
VRVIVAITYALGIALVALTRHADARCFALVFVLSQGLGALVAGALLARSLRPVPIKVPGLVRSLLSFGLKTQTASVAGITTLRLDQLLLSVLVSPADLGLYVVATGAASLAGPFFNAAAIIVMPRLNNLSSPERAIRTIWRELGRSLLLCVPVVAFAFAAMPLILKVLFGPAFASSLVTARILIVASLFQGMNAIVGNSMRAIGRPGAPAIAEVIGMIVTAGLLIALLPAFGALGAAIASFVSYAVVTAMYIVLLSRNIGRGAPRLAAETPEGEGSH